jgi:hypothetical protein
LDRRSDRLGRRRLLVAAADVGVRPARDGIEAAVAATDPAELVRAATFHGVAPALHVVLGDVESVPPDVSRDLERAYHAGVAFHLGVLEDVAYLDETLGAAGVPWLVLKGPALAQLYYHHPDIRPYSDLDVLVPPDAIGGAADALERSGTRFDDTSLILRDGPTGELAALLPSGRWLDLHWHVVNQPHLRRRLTVDVPPLFARAREVTLGRTTARTLSPADTLAHLSLHGCASGADRLVWLKDIVRCMQVEGPACAEHVDVSVGWGTSLMAAVCVQRACSVFGLGVPSDVAALVPHMSPWLTAARLVDRAVPVLDRYDRPTAARVLARSTRGTGRASIADLVRRGVLTVGHKVIRGRRPFRRRTPPADSGARRRAWLREVAAEN